MTVASFAFQVHMALAITGFTVCDTLFITVIALHKTMTITHHTFVIASPVTTTTRFVATAKAFPAFRIIRGVYTSTVTPMASFTTFAKTIHTRFFAFALTSVAFQFACTMT